MTKTHERLGILSLVTPFYYNLIRFFITLFFSSGSIWVNTLHIACQRKSCGYYRKSVNILG
ncbi:MAG: hypothetical protein EA365_12555 [Gloeocapsa sp. DLM2.Bin57]|nr:MAG: hypothetical protein EA365_12555 [Gloeocapsa sp. DLM2.Bin57]